MNGVEGVADGLSLLNFAGEAIWRGRKFVVNRVEGIPDSLGLLECAGEVIRRLHAS